MALFDFPRWKLTSPAAESGVVAPDERLSAGQTLVMGVQHAVAMFGATVLMPLLMGLDPNLSILMSGVGTLLFFVVTGGRVPSYLGSSAAFVGVVIAITGFNGQGLNPHLSVALGGIIACGLVYTLIGLVVMKIGTRWIERLMPPVVTGAVVMAIGLNLAPIAVRSVSASAFDSWMAVLTVLCIGIVAVFTRGMLQRLLILVGLIVACALYALLANGFGLGKPLDFSPLAQAAWFVLSHFTPPSFNGQAMMLIAPVAVILVAENLGHLKAVAGMTGRNMDPYMGRAFVGDGLATMLSGSVGGSGVTTYAENIGVMAVTKVYSTLAIAAEIILISAWAGKVDVRRVTVVQLATASLVAFAAMKPAGESVPPLTPTLLGVALGLGIFSAIIQVTMNWAQRSVSPTRATLIYTGEPVWAGIFGRLAGERLPLLALLGCFFILAGVLVSELKWKRKPPPQMSKNDDVQPLPELVDRREP